MIVIPAIDLLGGECVRLVKGDYGSAGKVAADPYETLRGFIADCANYVHIVDLDGAKAAKPVNGELILSLSKLPGAEIEVGGGIRELETVEYYLGGGVKRVILGSAALRNPQLVKESVSEFGDRIAVCIDAKDGMVKTSGWLEASNVLYTELAREMAGVGVKNIIFTDIDRDGTLEGPNLEQLTMLRDTLGVGVKLTASGGVSDMSDIKRLAALGIFGAIAGKSIYAGTLELKQAVRYVKGESEC